MYLIDDKSTLVWVMTSCHRDRSHYQRHCWSTSSAMPYVMTRGQWLFLLLSQGINFGKDWINDWHTSVACFMTWTHKLRLSKCSGAWICEIVSLYVVITASIKWTAGGMDCQWRNETLLLEVQWWVCSFRSLYKFVCLLEQLLPCSGWCLLGQWSQLFDIHSSLV